MDYIEGNRNNFVHQLACNLNRKGISYAEALVFILSDYNYNEIEVMNAVKSAYNNTHEFGTDREYKSPKTKETTKPKSSTTNEEEVDDDEEKPAAIERLEMFLNKRYNFRYNIVTGKLEYKKVRNQMYKPITDFVENSILREVLKAKVKCSIQGLRYLLMSDYVEQFVIQRI